MNLKNILIVDDEDETLGILGPFLESKGFNAFTANTGALAIEMANKNRVDLILLDIILPDIDGPEVAKELQKSEHTRSIPILFLSGIVSNSKQKNTFSQIDVNGKDYKALGKPFSREDLLGVISSLLD